MKLSRHLWIFLCQLFLFFWSLKLTRNCRELLPPFWRRSTSRCWDSTRLHNLEGIYTFRIADRLDVVLGLLMTVVVAKYDRRLEKINLVIFLDYSKISYYDKFQTRKFFLPVTPINAIIERTKRQLLILEHQIMWSSCNKIENLPETVNKLF